ncbi:hypothetical protein FWK35_00002262, partial [Aphis craccivora]
MESSIRSILGLLDNAPDNLKSEDEVVINEVIENLTQIIRNKEQPSDELDTDI